jgi:hypothetical protein
LKGLSPFNKERTPSFFVNDQKQFWHDFSSGRHGDIFDFVMETERVCFRRAVEKLAALAGMTMPDGQTPMPAPVVVPLAEASIARRSDDEKARLAMQRMAIGIWETSGDLGGTLGAQYLTGRKLVLPEGVSGRVLRFHSRCPWKNDADEVIHVPALIGLFRDIHTDEPKAISRRALTADGRKIGKPRSLGPVAGCAIKLTANEDVEQGLHIGEGVETMLAAMMLGFAPAWALGPGIRNFPLLAGVDTLSILVDNDANKAGQEAASACFDRWTAAGREVWCVVPDNVGADMNDVVVGGAE